MKKLLALTIISLMSASVVSAECPSVETLRDMTVQLAVQEKRGEVFSKDSLPQILACAEELQASDLKVAPQIIEVVARLSESGKGAY